MTMQCRSIAVSATAIVMTLGIPLVGSAQEIPAPLPEPPAVEAPEAPQAPEAAQEPVVVELSAVSGAQGSGEATLRTAPGDQTEAAVEVEGLAPGTEWSAFLIAGGCDQSGAVIAPLGTVQVADQGNGRGEAAVTTPLAELTTGNATVQLHPAGDSPTEAVLCGELAAAGPPAPVF